MIKDNILLFLKGRWVWVTYGMFVDGEKEKKVVTVFVFGEKKSQIIK